MMTKVRPTVQAATKPDEPKQMYTPAQFARLAGVTVRALHFYDQAGLLRPTRRENGQHRVRMYAEADLLQLQQILTLKFLGFSLAEIRDLLKNPDYDVKRVLRIQKNALDERIESLRKASRALELLTAHLENTQTVDWEQATVIITAMNDDPHHEWRRRFFADPHLAEMYARPAPTPSQIKAWSAAWDRALTAMKGFYDDEVPPAHPAVQAVVAEMKAMVDEFTGGDPEKEAGLRRMYQDVTQIPMEYRHPMHDEALQAYIMQALQTRGEPGTA